MTNAFRTILPSLSAAILALLISNTLIASAASLPVAALSATAIAA